MAIGLEMRVLEGRGVDGRGPMVCLRGREKKVNGEGTL